MVEGACALIDCGGIEVREMDGGNIMKTLLALFSLLIAVLFLPVPAHADFRIQSIDNDFQSEINAAADEGKRLVIFFHQLGCPYCDKMRARVHPDPKIMSYFNDHYVMIESNIKGNLDVVMPDGTPGNEVEFGRAMRVRATPVFAFYDLDGTLALKSVGFLDVDRFLLAGKYVVDGVHKTGKSYFNYLQEEQSK